MKVIKGLHALQKPLKSSVLTIGVFDGVHIGHRRVIGKVVARAKELRAKSVVVTFDPHPMKSLAPADNRTPSLISLDHRLKIVGSLGVDILVVVNFTGAVSGLSPRAFVKSILVDKLGVGEIYVSENFYFGKNAAAGVRELEALGREFGFSVRVVSPARAGGRIISSSLIRKLVTGGDLRKAALLLGRPVSVLGTVVSGARLARELGYPTANLNPHHEVIPPGGVYAVMVRYEGRLYRGVLNIGLRPTFYAPRDCEPAIEVHIFGFSGKVYGKDMEVFFMGKLRDERRFSGKADLVAQIAKDKKSAQALLGRPHKRKIKYS